MVPLFIMKKIKVSKTFMTGHMGTLEKDGVYECTDGFASYVVNRMKAGVYVSEKKPTKKKKSK